MENAKQGSFSPTDSLTTLSRSGDWDAEDECDSLSEKSPLEIALERNKKSWKKWTHIDNYTFMGAFFVTATLGMPIAIVALRNRNRFLEAMLLPENIDKIASPIEWALHVNKKHWNSWTNPKYYTVLGFFTVSTTLGFPILFTAARNKIRLISAIRKKKEMDKLVRSAVKRGMIPFHEYPEKPCSEGESATPLDAEYHTPCFLPFFGSRSPSSPKLQQEQLHRLRPQ